MYIAPISTDNYLGNVILLPSISIAPIWIASVWDDTVQVSVLVRNISWLIPIIVLTPLIMNDTKDQGQSYTRNIIQYLPFWI